MDKVIFEKIVKMGLIDDTSVTAESFKDLDDLFGSGKITVTGVKDYVYKLFGNVAEEPVVETVAEEPVVETVAEEPVVETVVEEPVVETVVEEPVEDTVKKTSTKKTATKKAE